MRFKTMKYETAINPRHAKVVSGFEWVFLNSFCLV